MVFFQVKHLLHFRTFEVLKFRQNKIIFDSFLLLTAMVCAIFTKFAILIYTQNSLENTGLLEEGGNNICTRRSLFY